MRPYGFVYLTTNLVNGKIYIGQHEMKGNNARYLGSGTYFLQALKKYGRNNFKRKILRVCFSQHELSVWEHVYIMKYKSYVKEIGYNISRGDVNTSNHNPAKLPEVRRKISNSMIGQHMSDSVKEQVSKRFRGILLSEDRKIELSKIAKNRRSITNGVKGGWLHEGEQMPEGWRYGRLPYRVKRKKRADRINHNTTLGLIWVNNGKQNLYIKKDSPIPDGYQRGMLKRN